MVSLCAQFTQKVIRNKIYHYKDLRCEFGIRLGVSICLDVISIETLDLDTKKVSLDGRENLDSFKKLVSILSRRHLPVPKVSIEIEKSVET